MRRKRKRRNPDEHRLNPREHPTMVAFEDAVGQDSFRKHPGRGKSPIWKKLGVAALILGILGAIGLGILKQKELNEPDERTKPRVLKPIEKEFEAAKARLDAFRVANSVNEKMSYVRLPVTNIDGYPALLDRMSSYYNEHTLRPHFPTLDRASTEVIKQGDTEFLKIAMENAKGVGSHIYFEKSATGYTLDWDSFVGYNPVSWTEFLVNPAEDSESGVFRLILRPTDHYTGIYQDEARWRSYAATDIGNLMVGIAYVPRDTDEYKAIEKALGELGLRDKKRVQVVAKVSLVDRGLDGSNLIHVEKLLRMGWLLP